MKAAEKLIEEINKEFGTSIPVTLASIQKLTDPIAEYCDKTDMGFCPECAGRQWKGN
jgi:hypothetical protein